MHRSTSRPAVARGLVARWVALGCLLLLAVARPSSAAPAADDPVHAQGLQWALSRIGAEAAWGRARGDGITIAIVDSGVDLGHEDLKAQLAGNVSCLGAGGDPQACHGSGQDDNGHGTHVAGIAAATTGNGVGIAGVAPGARVLAVRVLSNDCNPSGCTASGTSGDVAAGIRWAVANGADVINLSLGGGAMQSALGCAFCDAVEEAWAQGVIAVVAAGNDSILPAGFGDAHAVVVTATNRDDQRASYSNQNGGVLNAARWPVAAPGGEAEADPADCGTGGHPAGILSTFLSSGGSGYACLAGTSMAAPHVTGGLALLLSAGLTPQQAIDRLLGTATDLGPAGRDSSYGFGRIDLAKALDQLSAKAVGGGVATPTTAGGPATSGGTGTTAPVPSTAATVTTEAPVVSPPDTSLAAPFTLTPEPAGTPPVEEPAAWLVALAVGAAALAALGTSATAWHLARAR